MGGDRGEYIHSIFGVEGEKLADSVGEEMYKILGQQKKVYDKKSTNSNKDYYHMIRATKMTSIIVEVCFIDNAKDVQIADTESEQKRNGVVIAHGILKHYDIKIKGDSSDTSKPTTPNKDIIYRVVVGSFTIRENAEELQANLKKQGYDSFLDAYKKDGISYLRVIVGSYSDRSKAEARKLELEKKSYKPSIAVYNGDVANTPNDTVGKPVAPVKPSVAPSKEDREVQRYKEKGKCTIVAPSGIKFRDKPSTKYGKVQGTYAKGESVNYDLVVITDCYVWVSWTSVKTGARRYMPIKDRKKNERWGNCA